MAEAVPIDLYNCLICTDPYSDPRLLLCGHTFCCKCLSLYIHKEQVTADDHLYFPCPVCETPIVHNDINADVSTLAEYFPKNDLFVTQTTHSSGVHLCEPCQRGKESVPAVAMCTDCNEKLCTQCKIHHERSKALGSHNLASISENVGLLPAKTVYEICHRHDGKPLEVYCVDDTIPCCNICVSVSHRKCDDVQPIEDVIKKTTDELPSVEVEWKMIIEESKNMIDEDDIGIEALNTKETEVLTDVNNKIQKAKDNLDDLKSMLQCNVTDKFKECREQLLSRRKCVNAFLINAENSNMLLSRSDQQLSWHQRFFLREQTKNQMAAHFRRMGQNIRKKPNKFDITLRLEAMVDEITKMTTVGNVGVTSSFSPVSEKTNDRINSLIRILCSIPSTRSFADPGSAMAGSLQHLTVQTTPVTTEMDVWTGPVSCVYTVEANTLGGQKTPWLTGGIFTDNNELLFTENRNSRLLMFDDQYIYQREYKIDGHPTDIARGRTADEIFVAVDRNSILRCTLRNGQLSVISRITSPSNTWGIAVVGENLLAGSHEGVKVMSADGKVIKSILGGDYIYFAVSTATSTNVYYRDDDDIMCRRLDSDAIVFRYNDPSLREPTGIGLDRDHNVYVCGYSSGNIFLISPDGSLGRVLLPKLSNINYPWCIVVHPTKQEFVITSQVESTALAVYRFGDNNS